MKHPKYDELMTGLHMVRLYLLSMEHMIVEIDQLIYDMANVRAIRYDREPTHTPQNVKEERRLELIEEKADLEQQLDMTVLVYTPLKTKLVQTLEKLDPFICEIVLEKNGLVLNDDEFYVKGETKAYIELADEYGFTPQGLWAAVNREVNK